MTPASEVAVDVESDLRMETRLERVELGRETCRERCQSLSMLMACVLPESPQQLRPGSGRVGGLVEDRAMMTRPGDRAVTQRGLSHITLRVMP